MTVTFSSSFEGHHIFRRGMMHNMQLWPPDQNFQSPVWRSYSTIGGLNLPNPMANLTLHMASAEAPAYNGVWRQRRSAPSELLSGAAPPVGPSAEPLIGGQGRSRPEAVSLWAFGRQKEMANLPTFQHFANSVVQTSADMIHYIAAARNNVYYCIGLWVNQYSTWGRCRVAYLSDHLTN